MKPETYDEYQARRQREAEREKLLAFEKGYLAKPEVALMILKASMSIKMAVSIRLPKQAEA